MAQKKIRHKRRRSLLWSLADRLTAMIYSFFIHGRIGDMLSSRNTYCKRSFISRVCERKKIEYAKKHADRPRALSRQSITASAFLFLRGFWAALRVNVYGIFFTFYGISACITNLIPALLNGADAVDEMTLISSAILVICSIPLLFSQRAAIEAISSSMFLERFVFNILCVPKEMLRAKKQYGGTVYMFVSSLLGISLGILSMFSHPLLIPVIMLCLLVFLAIFALPEVGIITTLATTPFMKYIPEYESILIVMVLVTGISYLLKVIKKKRTFSLSPEITMVILFCGFVLAGGFASYGGIETFLDSLYAVTLILGGFLLTYNMISSERLLNACLKTLTASFLVLCLVGIWESVYNGISKRIIDSISPDFSSLTNGDILHILDDGVVFGMFAVFVFPLLFAYVTNRKSIYGAVAICSLGVILISAAWMCSHYEIMVTLFIELVIFWFMFSHKTMTVVLFSAIPLGMAILLYPYAVSFFGLPDISILLMEYIPANMEKSDISICVARDVLAMIADGNWLGIGAGENAFSIAFSSYSTDASSAAEHPMSFLLQLLCWAGVFGLLAFTVFLVFLVKRSLGFFISAEKKALRSKALAVFCGLVAALMLGNVYSIWEDVRVMYIFWIFTGLLMGHIRLADSEDDKKMTDYLNSSDAADVKVVFYD